MTAFKLETFNPVADPVDAAAVQRAEALEHARNEAYACGFKDGVNVTKDAVNAEETRILALIAEAISDAQITRREAGAMALRSLHPLAEALATHLAPALADGQFASRVADAAAAAIAHEAEVSPVIAVHPARADGIAAALAAKNVRAEVIATEGLGDLAAEIRWSDGCDRLDLSGFLADLTALTAEFQTLIEGEQDEHQRHTG